MKLKFIVDHPSGITKGQIKNFSNESTAKKIIAKGLAEEEKEVKEVKKAPVKKSK